MEPIRGVADALSVPVAELRGDEDQPGEPDRPEAFDLIRSALTGHPAIGTLLARSPRHPAARELTALRKQQAEVWPLVHANRYTELAPVLAALVPALETAARSASSDDQPGKPAPCWPTPTRPPPP